jgi:hypothetical protein
MGQPSNSSTQGILELGTGSFYMYKKKSWFGLIHRLGGQLVDLG